MARESWLHQLAMLVVKAQGWWGSWFAEPAAAMLRWGHGLIYNVSGSREWERLLIFKLVMRPDPTSTIRTLS